MATLTTPDVMLNKVVVAYLDGRRSRGCVRQLDLAPFDLLFWPHPLVIHQSVPGRSEALRRP
jgi:hypothetical protein